MFFSRFSISVILRSFYPIFLYFYARYKELERGNSFDPLNALAAKLFEQWSARGDDSMLGYLELINRNKYPIYAVALLIIFALVYMVRRRQKANA